MTTLETVWLCLRVYCSHKVCYRLGNAPTAAVFHAVTQGSRIFQSCGSAVLSWCLHGHSGTKEERLQILHWASQYPHQEVTGVTFHWPDPVMWCCITTERLGSKVSRGPGRECYAAEFGEQRGFVSFTQEFSNLTLPTPVR